MRLSCYNAGKDITEIVTKAFVKTLAIVKVGFECELKMSKLAQQNHDAHTGFFLGCFAEQKVRSVLPSSKTHASMQVSPQHCCTLCSGMAWRIGVVPAHM